MLLPRLVGILMEGPHLHFRSFTLLSFLISSDQKYSRDQYDIILFQRLEILKVICQQKEGSTEKEN